MQMVLQMDEEKMTTRGFHDPHWPESSKKRWFAPLWRESPPSARDWTPAV